MHACFTSQRSAAFFGCGARLARPPLPCMARMAPERRCIAEPCRMLHMSPRNGGMHPPACWPPPPPMTMSRFRAPCGLWTRPGCSQGSHLPGTAARAGAASQRLYVRQCQEGMWRPWLQPDTCSTWPCISPHPPLCALPVRAGRAHGSATPSGHVAAMLAAAIRQCSRHRISLPGRLRASKHVPVHLHPSVLIGLVAADGISVSRSLPPSLGKAHAASLHQ